MVKKIYFVIFLVFRSQISHLELLKTLFGFYKQET